MTVIFQLLLTLHFIGWAIVLGGWLVSLKARTLNKGVFHGAATALVAGTLAWLVTLPGWVGQLSLDAPKMAVKLSVTLAVTVLAWVATQSKESSKATALAGTLMGVLTLVNVVIAVFWR